MENNNILQKILLSREIRAEKQRALINKYKSSLISFTLNIPGPIKDSSLYRRMHADGMIYISELLNNEAEKIIYIETIHKDTGSEGYISVDTDPIRLKNYTIMVEKEHRLGRIFDLDIIDKNNNSIGRKDINMGPRKCLLCDQKALVCKRMQNHTTNELIGKIHDLAKEYFGE